MTDNKRNINVIFSGLAAFFIPVVITVAICLLYGFAPFGDKSVLMADMRYQFVDYFATLRRIAFGNDDVFYTLSKTFGGDMAGLLAYYCNTPFFYLLAFVPERLLPLGIILIMIFMLGLCGLNFNIFLNKAFGFRWGSLIFSTAYAFIGYLMGYFNCCHYFFDVALLPLVMLGLIEILREQKVSFLYIFSLALSIFSSYYLGYMTCLFSVLFFAYLCAARPSSLFGEEAGKQYHPEPSWILDIKERLEERFISPSFFKAFGIYAVSSVLAAGLSSVSLLCAVFSLRGQKSSGLSFSNGLIFNPLELFSGLYTGAFHGNVSDGLPLIYCGVLSAVLLMLFYFNRRISLLEKLSSVLVFAVLILSFAWDPLNTVWHGFAHPIGFPHRFSFLFSFFAIFLAYTCFININGALKTRDYIVTAAAFLLYSAFLVMIRNQYTGLLQILLTLGFMTASLISISLCRYGKHYMLPIVLGMLFISCLDAGYNAYVSIGAYFPGMEATEDYDLSEYQAFIDETGGIVEALKARERSQSGISDGDAFADGMSGDAGASGDTGSPGDADKSGAAGSSGDADKSGAAGSPGTAEGEPLYRIEKHYRRSNNDAMMFGYNGLSHFSSCETEEAKKFMGSLGFRDNGNWAYYGEEGSTTFADCFMGVKYLISQYDEIPRPFPLIMERDEKYVFENPYALPLAFTMTDEAEELCYREGSQEGGFDHFTYQNAIAGAFCGKEYNIYRPVKDVRVSTHNLTVDGNLYTKADKEAEAYIEYSFTADSADTIFMYFSAPETQDTTILVNGLMKQPYFTEYGWNIKGLGFYNEGEEVSLKIYLNQDSIRVDGFEFYYEDREELKRWREGLDEAGLYKLKSSMLSGRVSASESAGLLVFSIPYDRSWDIRVDGKKADPVNALSGLLSVRITPGEHSFSLDYMPLGFKAGLPIMIICALAVIAIMVRLRFRTKKE